MNEQTIRFRLGVFVLSALILLGVLIVLFGSVPTFLQPSHKFTIVFDNAAGVGIGTPVRYSGVKIGEVEDVLLDQDTGKVLVTIRVEGKYTLRQNDVPTLVQGLLGSDAAIEFVAADADAAEPQAPPPPPDRTPLEPGATLQGKVRVDARAIVQEAGKLFPPAEKALVDISRTLNRYERMAPVVEDTLKEYRALAVSARQVLPGVQDVSREFEGLARDARRMLPELKRTNEEVVAFVKDLRHVLPELGKTNNEIQALALETRKTLPQFKETMQVVQQAAQNWSNVGERAELFFRMNEPKLTELIGEMLEAVAGVADMVGEKNQKNLAQTLDNLQRGSRRLEAFGDDAGALARDARGTLAKMDAALTRANELFGDLQKVTKPLGESGGRTFTNLDEAAVTLNATLKDARDLLRVFARSDGTVQRLLSDPGLYNRIDETLCSLARVLPRLDHILRDVEIFADRIARHPEALGVRGAIAPSSGLKELPGPTIRRNFGP